MTSALWALAVLCAADIVSAQLTSATALASAYSLTTSTSLPFPTATLNAADADAFMVGGWSLSKGRVQNGADRLAFVDDPFPAKGAAAAGPVLQVLYPASKFGSTDSGAQFEHLWNTSDGSAFDSMIISYEVAFTADFDWVKGGKMPGLRGGKNTTGCSGGNKPNGTDCFSSRLMWRKEGDGEVYAYIPTPNKLCKDKDVICNSDFGTSIDRGTFSFVAGEWTRVTLLVQMNNPVDTANGNVEIYFNDVKALQKSNLQFRSSSAVNINGLYFSTFFGGDDKTWEPSSDQFTYFRNFTLWGGSAPSNLTGAHISAAPASIPGQLWSTPVLALSALAWWTFM